MARWVGSKVEDGVAVIAIDRPPANALDQSLVIEILESLRAASLDPAVAAAIVVGTGDIFVAGADINILRELDRPGFLAFLSTIQEAFDEIEAMPLPTLAALNGHAMGGGLEFALACDIRFAADEVRLGLPEVKLGLLPGAGGTQRLLRAVGKGRALDLL